MPGMRWSEITSATGSRAMSASASPPELAVSTRQSSLERAADGALIGRLVVDGENSLLDGHACIVLDV